MKRISLSTYGYGKCYYIAQRSLTITEPPKRGIDYEYVECYLSEIEIEEDGSVHYVLLANEKFPDWHRGEKNYFETFREAIHFGELPDKGWELPARIVTSLWEDFEYDVVDAYGTELASRIDYDGQPTRAIERYLQEVYMELTEPDYTFEQFLQMVSDVATHLRKIKI